MSARKQNRRATNIPSLFALNGGYYIQVQLAGQAQIRESLHPKRRLFPPTAGVTFAVSLGRLPGRGCLAEASARTETGTFRRNIPTQSTPIL